MAIALPIAAAHAAESPAVVSVSPTVINYGGTPSAATGSAVTFTVKNPASNAGKLTEATLTFPTTLAASVAYAGAASDCAANTASNVHTFSSSSSITEDFTISPSLPAGASCSIQFTITPPNLAAANELSAVPSFSVSSTAFDSSSSGSTPANSVSISLTVATALAVSAASASPTAGSVDVLHITETVPAGYAGQSGLPVALTDSGSATYDAAEHYNVTSGVTTSNNELFVAWTPDPLISDAPAGVTVTATSGSSASITGTSGTVTVIAGTPSKAIFTGNLAYSKTVALNETAFGTPSYETSGDYAEVASGTPVASAADAYGNPITWTTVSSCSFTAFGGLFDLGGGVSSSTNAGTCTTTTSSTNKNYFQSGNYGTTGYLEATISGKYNGNPYTVSGLSANIFTSVFDTSANTPTTTATSFVDGSTITIKFALTNPQSGVPVTFTAVNGSASNGFFVGGMGTSIHHGAVSDPANITVTTGSAGTATVSFTLDNGQDGATYPTFNPVTTAFHASITQLTNAAPGFITYTSAALSETTTTGAAAGFAITTFFDNAGAVSATSTVPGQNIYFDVSLVDSNGNILTSNTFATYSFTMTATFGSFSASSLQITFGCTDTTCTYGTPIPYLSIPASAVVGSTDTIKAQGLYTGTASLPIVSPNPVLNIKSPTTSSGIAYSNVPGVSLSGTANVSAGVYPVPTINHVYVSVDGGAYQVASGSGAAKVSWSFIATMSNGLHTVTVFTNDSNSATSSVSKLTVLVDTSAPTLSFTTAANANLTGGTPVMASIVDSEGDLNSSSVMVTDNGTALAASQVSVSGNNNPGSSVTYTVTISGLGTGEHNLKLSASDLAGNSAAAVTLTVHVTVPFAQSFVVSGTPSAATLNQFAGINASYTNLNPTAQNVVVFAVFKNSAGQTIGVGTGSLSAGAGATQSVFIADPVGLAAGTYSVSIFVFTTGNLPVSVTTTISVTV